MTNMCQSQKKKKESSGLRGEAAVEHEPRGRARVQHGSRRARQSGGGKGGARPLRDPQLHTDIPHPALYPSPYFPRGQRWQFWSELRGTPALSTSQCGGQDDWLNLNGSAVWATALRQCWRLSVYEGVFAFKEIRTERFRGKWPHAEIILNPFRKKMKKKKKNPEW